jgi:hypothetical protein
MASRKCYLGKCEIEQAEPIIRGAAERTLYEEIVNIPAPLDLLDGVEFDKIKFPNTHTYFNVYYKNKKLSTVQDAGDIIICTNPNSYDSILFSVREFGNLVRLCQNLWVLEKMPNNIMALVRIKSIPGMITKVNEQYQEFVQSHIKELYRLPINDCIEFFKSIGAEIHFGRYSANDNVSIVKKNQYTVQNLEKIFDKYSTYSEVDYLSFDWSEYDKKIYPLVLSSKLEIGASMHISENNKIVVTDIQDPGMPGSTIVHPLDFICFHLHPAARYDGLFIEMPSTQDILNTMERHILKSSTVAFVGAKEGTYILTLARHLTKYGFTLFDKLVNNTSLKALFDIGPTNFELFIDRFKRICMNCGVVMYFRPAKDFDIKKATINYAAKRLKYTKSYLAEQSAKIQSFKKHEEFLSLDYSDFDNIKYLFDMQAMFWVAFDKNKPVLADEDDVVLQETFNGITSNTFWPQATAEFKIVLVYFPQDNALITSGINSSILQYVMEVYDLKWMIFLSPSYINVTDRNIDKFYGPYNRKTKKLV